MLYHKKIIMTLENTKLQEIKEQNLQAEVWEGISEVSEWVSNVFEVMVEKLAEKRKKY